MISVLEAPAGGAGVDSTAAAGGSALQSVGDWIGVAGQGVEVVGQVVDIALKIEGLIQQKKEFEFRVTYICFNTIFSSFHATPPGQIHSV